MENRLKFLQVYLPLLEASILAEPKKYAYGVDKAPEVARKVINALNGFGVVSLTPAMKETACALGIEPTLKAIEKYLNS